MHDFIELVVMIPLITTIISLLVALPITIILTYIYSL